MYASGYGYGSGLIKTFAACSVDMMRIRFRLNKKIIENTRKGWHSVYDDIQAIFNSFIFMCDLRRNRFKLGRYMWEGNIGAVDTTIWIAFARYTLLNENSKSTTSKINGYYVADEVVIEFNPSKVQYKLWLNLYCRLADLSESIELVRFDGAFDFSCKRQAMLLRPDQRRYMRYGSSEESKTEYLGKNNGRVKIYNKTIESFLNYDLTRVEISVNTIAELEQYFPKITVVDMDKLGKVNYDIMCWIKYPDLMLMAADYMDRKTFRKRYEEYSKAVQGEVDINELEVRGTEKVKDWFIWWFQTYCPGIKFDIEQEEEKDEIREYQSAEGC